MTRRELEHLVQDLLEGVLRRGDAAALEAELRGNPEARGVYRHHVLLHNALQLRAEGLHLTYAVPMEEAIARGRRRLMRRATLAAAAVMAAAAVVMGLIVVLEPAPVLTFAVAPGTEVRLSHAADGAEVPEGPRLEVGSRLELRRGVVELDFASGVRGIVRAPASVTLQAGDRLSLHEGTGWFEVPGKAAGFRLAPDPRDPSRPRRTGRIRPTERQRGSGSGTAPGIDPGNRWGKTPPLQTQETSLSGRFLLRIRTFGPGRES